MLIKPPSADEVDDESSAGAMSDLQGLLAAGVKPLSCKPTQASSPGSAASGRRSFPVRTFNSGPELPNITLRPCEKVARSKGAHRILLYARDPKSPSLCQSLAPPLVSRAYQHGKTDACGSEHALGSSGQLLWFVCTRRVEYVGLRDTGVLR